MKTYLVCNVGNQDVKLPDAASIDDAFKMKGKLIARKAGQHISDHWEAYRETLEIPIILKAIHHIKRTMPPENSLSVVLFASNQPESEQDRFRDTDTIFFAQIIQRFVLSHAFVASKKDCRIIEITRNPADYDLMQDLYEEKINQIIQQIEPDSLVYALLAGGTPAMNTMLLFYGTHGFSERFIPLYVSVEKETIELDVHRKMLYRFSQKAITTALQTFNYSVCLKLLHEQENIYSPHEFIMLKHLYHYADCRSHFNYDHAISHIQFCITKSRLLRNEFQGLFHDVADKTERCYMKNNLMLAEIDLENGNWGSFINRMNRIYEGSLHLLCESLGVEWSNKERTYFKQAWWGQNQAFLQQIGLSDPDDPSNATKREVKTDTMRSIVTHLAQGDQTIQAILAYLENIAKIKRFRNRIIHDYLPISREEIEKAVSIDTLVGSAKHLYEHQFNQAIGINAYHLINHVSSKIMAGVI